MFMLLKTTFWEYYQPLDYTFPALEKINIKYLLNHLQHKQI